MEFEWDEAKDSSNQQKHGLAFSEAAELFRSDDEYLEIFDADHSDDEDRFVAIGPIVRGLIVVAYTEPEEGVVRIMSAREATQRERSLFHNYMDGTR